MTDDLAVGPGRKLVLVVDDSPDMRGLIHDVLTDQGYEVVTASSGGRALSLMAERLPDLVITDLMMPGMTGFTLRGELLRRPAFATVPVVVLSAFWQRSPDTLDVVDVLTKPLNLDRLVAAVRQALSPGGPVVGEGEQGTASAPDGGGELNGRSADAGRIQQEA